MLFGPKRSPKMEPKWNQMDPRWLQDGSKMAPGWPKMVQDGPRWTQDVPKVSPRWLKVAKSAYQVPPRGSRVALRWPPEGPQKTSLPKTPPVQVTTWPYGRVATWPCDPFGLAATWPLLLCLFLSRLAYGYSSGSSLASPPRRPSPPHFY